MKLHITIEKDEAGYYVAEVPAGGVPLKTIFPIAQWIDAYTHYSYPVRIFAFSEFREKTIDAARTAMQKVVGIKGNEFYEGIKRRGA
jgi:hypothetical protein